MLVEGKKLTTILFDIADDLVKIIDQRLLPHELKIVNVNTLIRSIQAVQRLHISYIFAGFPINVHFLSLFPIFSYIFCKIPIFFLKPKKKLFTDSFRKTYWSDISSLIL